MVLLRKRRGRESGQKLKDGVIHGGGHCASIRIVAEGHSEIAVHGSGIKSTRITFAQSTEGRVVLGAPGKNCSPVINMGVDDDKSVGIFGTSNLELAEITFEL
jgi:hypothetical protein